MAIFHILSLADWDAAQKTGAYEPPSLEKQGFIHFCEDRQLLAVARQHFQGQSDLWVISVREDLLRAALVREPVGDQVYPHLYGPLNLKAVVDIVEFRRSANGDFILPVEWQPWGGYFGFVRPGRG